MSEITVTTRHAIEDDGLGSRDLEMTLEREGVEDSPISIMFDADGCETFDPILAVEIDSGLDGGNGLTKLRPGDVIRMRVTINL